MLFSEAVDDGRLAFDLIRLPQVRAIGVARKLTTKAGIFELHLVFDRQPDFLRWISDDEYRHQAQAMFAQVKSRFDEMLRTTESPRGTGPGTSRR
jgi:hypothetical protein